MSHRFDSTHKLASNQDAAIAAMAGVRDEVTGGGGRRRRWSKADKARIVQESLKPGAVVSEVAQRHGLTRWQLYDWRRKARTAAGDRAEPARPKRNGSTSKPVEALPAFAPVVMATPAIPPQPAASDMKRAWWRSPSAARSGASEGSSTSRGWLRC